MPVFEILKKKASLSGGFLLRLRSALPRSF
jgi:hypothetical protein